MRTVRHFLARALIWAPILFASGPLVAQVDLGITQKPWPAKRLGSGPVRYEIVVHNHGSTAAEGVKVRSTSGRAVSLAASGDGWVCIERRPFAVCGLRQGIVPGGSAGLALELEISAAPGWADLAVWVSSLGTEVDLSNNAAWTQVPISSAVPICLGMLPVPVLVHPRRLPLVQSP